MEHTNTMEDTHTQESTQTREDRHTHEMHINESILSKEILEDQKKNRIDHMTYLPGMEDIGSEILDQVVEKMNAYDYDQYTAADVKRALAHSQRTPEDFQALLSPAALPYLEEIAQAAQVETRKHFGNSVYMFTPIYIANYCENYCIYCGFNCHNKINRARLNAEEIEKEMQAIAATGLQEILILTGESRSKSDVEYIGEACKIARKYFKVIGLEIYPVNSDEYAYLHECGADYVTVLGVTDNLTIQGCKEAAEKYGKEIVVDMICVDNMEERIARLEELGVHGLAVHTGTDQQAAGRTPLDDLKVMAAAAKSAKISVAGGIHADTVKDYAVYKPDVLIVGGGICHAEDPVAAAKEIYMQLK